MISVGRNESQYRKLKCVLTKKYMNKLLDGLHSTNQIPIWSILSQGTHPQNFSLLLSCCFMFALQLLYAKHFVISSLKLERVVTSEFRAAPASINVCVCLWGARRRRSGGAALQYSQLKMPGGGCWVTTGQFSSSLLSPQLFSWLQISEPRRKQFPLVQWNLHSAQSGEGGGGGGGGQAEREETV